MVKIINFEEGGGVKRYWAISHDTNCKTCGTAYRFETVREFRKVRYNVHKGEVVVWDCPVCGTEWEWHQFPEDLSEDQCFITPHILAGNKILFDQAKWWQRGSITRQAAADSERFKVVNFKQSDHIKALHDKLKARIAAKQEKENE